MYIREAHWGNRRISIATSALTRTSIRVNSNPRSKDGGKSGIEWMVMWSQRLWLRPLTMGTLRCIPEFMLLWQYCWRIVSICTAVRNSNFLFRKAAVKLPQIPYLRLFTKTLNWTLSVFTRREALRACVKTLKGLHIELHRIVLLRKAQSYT